MLCFVVAFFSSNYLLHGAEMWEVCHLQQLPDRWNAVSWESTIECFFAKTSPEARQKIMFCFETKMYEACKRSIAVDAFGVDKTTLQCCCISLFSFEKHIVLIIQKLSRNCTTLVKEKHFWRLTLDTNRWKLITMTRGILMG